MKPSARLEAAPGRQRGIRASRRRSCFRAGIFTEKRGSPHSLAPSGNPANGRLGRLPTAVKTPAGAWTVPRETKSGGVADPVTV